MHSAALVPGNAQDSSELKAWHAACCTNDALPFGRALENAMLHYALAFLVIAIVAAALGFGALAGVAAVLAKGLFFVFLVLFAASLLYSGLRRV